MEDTSKFKRHRQTQTNDQSLAIATADSWRRRGVKNTDTEEHGDENGDINMEEGKSEMWNNFSNRFRQVQSVLDRNRLLIKQVNDNHQARTHDNMVQNVGLIQELNGNITKVVSLYSDLSTNFSTMFHQENDSIEEDESSNDQRHR